MCKTESKPATLHEAWDVGYVQAFNCLSQALVWCIGIRGNPYPEDHARELHEAWNAGFLKGAKDWKNTATSGQVERGNPHPVESEVSQPQQPTLYDVWEAGYDQAEEDRGATGFWCTGKRNNPYPKPDQVTSNSQTAPDPGYPSITEVSELEALPAGSIVFMHEAPGAKPMPFEKFNTSYWFSAAISKAFSDADVFKLGPLTLLYTPAS